MNKAYPLGEIQKLLAPAQNILVLIPATPTFDQVASGLALFLSLTKSGKQVSILSPDQPVVEFSRLVGADKISDKVPAGELVLTINTPIENIEKVTSNDEGGKLNLVIQPKPGLPPVTQEDILFTPSGAMADLLIVIEPKRLDSLGKIYKENEKLFQEKPVVNINHYTKAESLGTLNVLDSGASSSSEIVVALLEGLQLPADEDITQNLLLGLKQATQSFQSSNTTADTFEAAAFCLRHGGSRTLPQPRREEPKEPVQPIETKQASEEAPVAESEAQLQTTPQPDWFEPKIYRGSKIG